MPSDALPYTLALAPQGRRTSTAAIPSADRILCKPGRREAGPGETGLRLFQGSLHQADTSVSAVRSPRLDGVQQTVSSKCSEFLVCVSGCFAGEFSHSSFLQLMGHFLGYTYNSLLFSMLRSFIFCRINVCFSRSRTPL